MDKRGQWEEVKTLIATGCFVVILHNAYLKDGIILKVKKILIDFLPNQRCIATILTEDNPTFNFLWERR